MIPPAPETRWKCICAYDGTHFAGWQSQRGGTAIQDVIEARLQQIFGKLIRIHASGRTDAGVHALGQVFHFDAAWKHDPEKLRVALRGGIPSSIQLKSLRAVSPNFHSRFSAKGKCYIYRIHIGETDPFIRPFVWEMLRPTDKPLDLKAMTAAADILQGKHDFRAFSALNGPPKEDTVRDLRCLELNLKGRLLRINAEADGFMYKMVRSLVGTLVAAGDGKLSLPELRKLLASGQRTTAVQTAPPQGLFLARVFY